VNESDEPVAKGQGETKAELLGRAEALLVAGYEGMKERESTIPAQDSDSIPAALDRLIKVYEALENHAQAARYKELRAAYPDDSDIPTNTRKR
jgi:predicted RNase H-like HicB family nuclease